MFTLESVVDGALVFSVVVREREAVGELVSALRETGAEVCLEELCARDAGYADRLGVEGCSITDKQREALELAVELGYYDDPRRADLQDLADRLGISRSAVSQRLNAAESKVVRSLVSD